MRMLQILRHHARGSARKRAVYKALAFACYGGVEHREVSLMLLGKALGAKKASVRQTVKTTTATVRQTVEGTTATVRETVENKTSAALRTGRRTLVVATAATVRQPSSQSKPLADDGRTPTVSAV